MIERKRILHQTGIFLKQNPGEEHLTTDDLQQLVANNQIPRYLANLTGSNAYWFKAREDLKAIVNHV